MFPCRSRKPVALKRRALHGTQGLAIRRAAEAWLRLPGHTDMALADVASGQAIERRATYGCGVRDGPPAGAATNA